MCANMFVASIIDALPCVFLIFLAMSVVKNSWIVSILFLFAIFAMFVGSTPIVLISCLLNPVNRVPSFEPRSTTRSF